MNSERNWNNFRKKSQLSTKRQFRIYIDGSDDWNVFRELNWQCLVMAHSLFCYLFLLSLVETCRCHRSFCVGTAPMTYTWALGTMHNSVRRMVKIACDFLVGVHAANDRATTKPSIKAINEWEINICTNELDDIEWLHSTYNTHNMNRTRNENCFRISQRNRNKKPKTISEIIRMHFEKAKKCLLWKKSPTNKS